MRLQLFLVLGIFLTILTQYAVANVKRRLDFNTNGMYHEAEELLPGPLKQRDKVRMLDQLRQRAERIKDLRAQVEHLEREKDELLHECKTERKEQEEEIDSLSPYKDKYAEAERKIVAKEDQIKALDKKEGDLSDQLTRQEDLVRDKQEKITSLESEIDRKQHEIKRLNELLESRSQCLSDLEICGERLKAQKMRTQKEFEVEQQRFEKELIELTEKNNRAEERMSRLETERNDYAAQLQEQVVAAEKQQEEFKYYQDTVEQQKQELAEKTDQLSLYEQEKGVMPQGFERLSDMQVQKDDSGQPTSELMQLKEEKAKLKTQLDEKKVAADTYEKERVKLQAQLKEQQALVAKQHRILEEHRRADIQETVNALSRKAAQEQKKFAEASAREQLGTKQVCSESTCYKGLNGMSLLGPSLNNGINRFWGISSRQEKPVRVCEQDDETYCQSGQQFVDDLLGQMSDVQTIQSLLEKQRAPDILVDRVRDDLSQQQPRTGAGIRQVLTNALKSVSENNAVQSWLRTARSFEVSPGFEGAASISEFRNEQGVG